MSNLYEVLYVQVFVSSFVPSPFVSMLTVYVLIAKLAVYVVQGAVFDAVYVFDALA